MQEIKYESGITKPDFFNFYEDGKKVGEMAVSTRDKNLTVYHTEVDQDKQGKGYAGQLIEAMINYARKNELKVTPNCPYVKAKFKKEPTLYSDIWDNTEN